MRLISPIFSTQWISNISYFCLQYEFCSVKQYKALTDFFYWLKVAGKSKRGWVNRKLIWSLGVSKTGFARWCRLSNRVTFTKITHFTVRVLNSVVIVKYNLHCWREAGILSEHSIQVITHKTSSAAFIDNDATVPENWQYLSTSFDYTCAKIWDKRVQCVKLQQFL